VADALVDQGDVPDSRSRLPGHTLRADGPALRTALRIRRTPGSGYGAPARRQDSRCGTDGPRGVRVRARRTTGGRSS